jgi:hypothetical protein
MRVWLPGSVVALVLALVGTVGFLLLDHQRDMAETERLQRVNAERVAEDWEASVAESKAKIAAQERAAARRKERRKAAQLEAARVRAARAKAAEIAAEEQAIQDAADDAATLEAAAELALEELAVNGHDLRGRITVPDVTGALVAAAGGYPGQAVSSLPKDKQARMRVLATSLGRGNKYPCSGGAGGSYGDLLAGTEVLVTHESGGVIASTALVGGLVDGSGCTFTFAVRVPDAESYGIEVASRFQSFTDDELTAAGWFVDLGL